MKTDAISNTQNRKLAIFLKLIFSPFALDRQKNGYRTKDDHSQSGRYADYSESAFNNGQKKYCAP